ncbi:hypothetical protein D4Q76_01080 [archaeon]|nr:MAG: hypothetical protein D4Q76_01080 [archaeon]
MKRNVKLFAGILIILIVAVLSFFILFNNSQEAKPIKDANDLSKSYYELKQKAFINVLYDFSYTRFNNTSYYLYMKNKNNFTFIQGECNENLDVINASASNIQEDEFFASIHAFPDYYFYETHYFKPQIIDYSNMFLSFGCFNTTIAKKFNATINETNKIIICFNQPSGIITKLDNIFNSNGLNYNMSRNLVYASFKEETPENIIKNNNPCNLTAIVENY